MVEVQFTTAAVGALCVTAFVLPALLGSSEPFQHALCFAPFQVVSRFQVYRVITAPFVHMGFFHILMNMFAWYFLGNPEESKLGSLNFLYNVFGLMLPMCAGLHLVTAYALDFLLGWHTTMEGAVGMSGLLFALLVVSLEYSESVSIFGLFDMPSKWYPLFIAVVLQLLSPGLSLLGHLSGIAVGYAFLSSRLDFLKLSTNKISYVEDKLSLRSLSYWVSPPSGFGAYVGGAGYGNSRGGGSQGTNGNSFSSTLGAARGRIASLFSSDGSAAHEQKAQVVPVFQGTGHTIGGQSLSGGGSRSGVPSTSRLLQMTSPKKSAHPGGSERDAEGAIVDAHGDRLEEDNAV